LLGVEQMELLKKILELISEFLAERRSTKLEKEEIKRVETEQVKKTQDKLQQRKDNVIKPPKPKDFFNDDSW
jgi:ElaB/YqjD/DUF883 family membrane-anchored ribosome-binding protein